MLVTNLNSPELENYAKLNPYFADAFRELRKMFEEGVADGKHIFDGDKFFINVFSYDSKKLENACFEAHKKYIDVQMVLKGNEIMAYESEDKLTLTKEYDEGGDCMLYAMNDEFDAINVRAGELVIFFPEEPHAPGIAVNGNSEHIQKAVGKILVG